jgi:hypothetical protein
MARVVTGPGSRPAGKRATVTADYRNPFRSAAVSPERIDQGVDYAGRSGDPIYALGPAKVIEVINYGGNSGWPDGSGAGTSGGWVSYQLSSGPLMGRIVYVAEGVQPAVRAGDRVDSSTVVGHFAGGGGIETGWAGPPSQGDQTLAYSQGQSDFNSGDIGGWNTEAGVTFSNLMASLGAPAGIAQAGGVHGAGGRLVNVTATQTSPGGTSGGGSSGGAGPDCLITFPALHLAVIPHVYTQTLTQGTCLLTKGATRGLMGAVMIVAGGSMLMLGTLVLAAYGLRGAGAKAGPALQAAGGALAVVPGAEVAGAAVAATGSAARAQGASGRTQAAAGGVRRVQGARKKQAAATKKGP